MQKSNTSPTLVLMTSALLVSVTSGLPAQNDAGKPAPGSKLGLITGHFEYTKLTPSLWHFVGGIGINSKEYDLAASDIKVFFLPGKAGQSALDRATADGSPAAGKQVDVHVRRPLERQAYEIKSDHTVYTPDATRPNGGKMVFTGHVTVITTSNSLSAPSVATFDTKPVTVLLGQGEDYPQLETGPGNIVLTPAQ